MACVYIGVGANIEPEVHIPAALRRLSDALRITGVSTFYHTAPLGRPEQQAFINGVVAAETDLPPLRVKQDVLRPIEAALGRVRTEDAYAARSIDLDLLLYDDLVMNEATLTLPDPDIMRRPFLAVPLAELAPTLVLPHGAPIRDIAAGFAEHDMEPLDDFTAALRKELL